MVQKYSVEHDLFFELYSYYLHTEIKPVITKPSKDEFITRAENDNEAIVYECIAEGIPIPLVYWYYNNETRIENTTYLLNITETLGEGRHVYICIAENRQGNASRTVSVVVTSDQIGTDVIEGTNDLINDQDLLDGEQAINLASLVDSVIKETINENKNENGTSYTPESDNSTKTEPKKITLASDLFLNVINKWDPDTRRNDSKVREDEALFNTNANLLNTTRTLQKGVTEQIVIMVSQFFSLPSM